MDFKATELESLHNAKEALLCNGIEIFSWKQRCTLLDVVDEKIKQMELEKQITIDGEEK